LTFPADHQQPEVLGVAMAEPSLELVGARHVVQLPEPIDDLAEAALEPAGPLGRCLSSLLPEQAAGRGILPLNQAERLSLRIAHDEVAPEVAEELVLEGQQVAHRYVPAVTGAYEGCQLLVRLEEGLDVGLLFQFGLAVQKLAKRHKIAQALSQVEGDADELLHVEAAPFAVTRRSKASFSSMLSMWTWPSLA